MSCPCCNNGIIEANWPTAGFTYIPAMGKFLKECPCRKKEEASNEDAELQSLRSKVAALEAEVKLARERLGPAGYKVLERVKELESKLSTAQAENRTMREALKFYADKSTYVSRSGKIGINPIYTDDCEPYHPDDDYPGAAGKRARAALAGINKGGKKDE